MSKQNITVVHIRRDMIASDACPPLVNLLSNLWLETNLEGGSAEENFVAALRQPKRTRMAGLFLVSNRKAVLHPFLVLRLHLN
jgi:hypothetical protein